MSEINIKSRDSMEGDSSHTQQVNQPPRPRARPWKGPRAARPNQLHLNQP